MSINVFEAELSKKANKVDLEKLAKTPSIDEEKVKKIQRSFQELQLRVEQIDGSVERRIQKLKKDLDINIFIRQIKSKADEEKVHKGFDNVDSKLAALADTLQLLKKEIDQSTVFLQKISVQSFKYNENACLSTKAIQPQACLSCGNTAIPSTSAYNVNTLFYVILNFSIRFKD